MWDYPRPPRAEPTSRRVRVVLANEVIADSTRSIRVLETSHPPVYYIPDSDIRMAWLHPSGKTSFCEFKGEAHYWDVAVGRQRRVNAAWGYPKPSREYEIIRDHLAFYPGLMDGCYVGDERVAAQPGDFYGGWITSDIEGPFKGGKGSEGW